MSESNEVPVEEEFEEDGNGNEKSEDKDWSEEFKIAGDELADTVKKLWHEAGVRRIVVKAKDGRVLVEIPVVFGVAGIIILPTALSALALVAALVTECSIVVERSEKEPEVDEAAS